MFKYKKFSERIPDGQYRNLLERILSKGQKVYSQQEEDALMVLGHQMRFDLKNGFPIITERDIVSAAEGRISQAQMAIGELCAFLNGARTLKK